MPGCSAIAWPITAPGPVTTWNAPGGSPASARSSPKRSAVSGVTEAGFRTTVFPRASAGAIFHIAWRSGKFHGVIAPTTPTGSRSGQEERVRAPGERVAVELVGVLAEVGQALGRRGHVDLGGLEDRLSVVEGLDAAERLRAREQQVGRAHQDPAALARLHRRPRRPTRSALRAPATARSRSAAEASATSASVSPGRRVDRREALSGGGGSEGAVDEEVGSEVECGCRRHWSRADSLQLSASAGRLAPRRQAVSWKLRAALLPLELRHALLLVRGDAFLGVLALEEQLLQLALDRQRRLERQVPARLHRALDAADGLARPCSAARTGARSP